MNGISGFFRNHRSPLCERSKSIDQKVVRSSIGCGQGGGILLPSNDCIFVIESHDFSTSTARQFAYLLDRERLFHLFYSIRFLVRCGRTTCAVRASVTTVSGRAGRDNYNNRSYAELIKRFDSIPSTIASSAAFSPGYRAVRPPNWRLGPPKIHSAVP